ncbi:MAG: bZIP transcription factor [Candidatus Micrarchaeota archaeon]
MNWNTWQGQIIISLIVSVILAFVNWLTNGNTFNSLIVLGIVLLGTIILFFIVIPLSKKFIVWLVPKIKDINFMSRLKETERKISQLQIIVEKSNEKILTLEKENKTLKIEINELKKPVQQFPKFSDVTIAKDSPFRLFDFSKYGKKK